jgi:hypothetical protein
MSKSKRNCYGAEFKSAAAALRPTTIAITTWTKRKRLAPEFIAFLKSKPAHDIFQKLGWE